MDKNWRLGFIGAGVMAETMIAGVLDAGSITPEGISASGPRETRRNHLAGRYGIQVTANNLEVAENVDLLVLSVKPQTLAEVLTQLKGHLPANTTVLSIVAGASLQALRVGLLHEVVARAMPNLPCRIRKGMTVWTGASGESAERIRTVLRGMGGEIHVAHESDVDRATAVNGTGPAIVAEFLKALMEAATYIGQPRSLARETVLATLLGTAEMIQASEEHVAQLIDEVTSPGGTSARALQALKRGRMSAVITEAVDLAFQRTLQLGAELEHQVTGRDKRNTPG